MILAANWKMNLPEEGVTSWVDAVHAWPREEGIEIVVGVPFPFLREVAERARSVRVAAQNLSEHESGAFTADVSATMLRQVGCTDVIIGHSERREIFGETDEMIGRKLRLAASAGLRPILCVGETREVRRDGRTVEVLDAQLKAALGAVDRLEELVIAYEPVWAIGTGDNATSDQVEEAHRAIRKLACDLGYDDLPVIYGGSVKPDNAADLAATDGVDGFLVGGASLHSSTFRQIRDAMR